MISEAILVKLLQLVGQAAQFKFESQFEPLPVIWQSLRRLFHKVIRFRGQNQRPSSSGRSPAPLSQVGRASTNTGRFLVGGSRCGPRPARLKKHGTTFAILTQFKSQQGLMLCKFRTATSHFFSFSCEMKLPRNWQEVVADQGCAHRYAQSFDHSLVSEYKYVIGAKQHVPNRILCKAADLNRRPVREKGVCSDSNRTAQRLQMAARKSLETMSGVILNRSRPRFAAKSIANEMQCLKAMW